MAQTSTPFWLEIKTEYIDANLDKVLDYLSKESREPGTDPFWEETEKLLGQRVRELTGTLAAQPLSAEESRDKEQNLRDLRLLGAWLLIQDKLNTTEARGAYFFFLKTLSALVPETLTEELTELAAQCLVKREITALGFSWSDIKTVQAEVMAHKLLRSAAFGSDNCPDTWYQGKGSVRIHEGFIELHETNRDDALFAKTASSLMLLDQTISVQTPAGDRIQQKDEDDLDAMSKFTMDVLRQIASVKPSPDRSLKRYDVGDIVPVRFLGSDAQGNLYVETVEGDYEHIGGTIPAKSNVFRNIYSAADVATFLQKGDIFDAEYKGGARCLFDLSKPFLQILLDDTIRSGEEITAVLKNINAKGLMCWWTSDGYPAYVEGKDDSGSYNLNDCARIYIEGKQSNGYVYASIVGPTDEKVDEEDSRRYCVEGILYNKDYQPAAAPEGVTLDKSFVRGLCRLLFRYQKSLGRAAERFRILCVSRILAAMTEDSAAEAYIGLACDYLHSLVLFSSGHIDKIKPIQAEGPLADEPGIARRREIVRILQAYGVDADSDYLSNIIHGSEDPLLVQLAKLVQSCNRIDDVYPAIKTVIKREITRFLAVETEDNTDFEEAAGPNLGVENSRTEFKTSFLFAPSNAYEQNQEKNIFRSLCSFLNTSEGGTLYLGVNDSGGVNGLDTDLEALPKKTHNAYKGIDGYIRYITDRAREYFDLDVRIHFHIEPAYDNKVVAIRVDPYEHGVVEFEGIPYIRNNSESVKMSQTLRRQIETRRISQALDKPAKNVVALTEAIKEEQCVILHGYSSSSSGEVKQYTVEPFAFMGNYTYLWAYDVQANANKVFRISRIGNVQVTRDPWTCKSRHKRGQADIFHFTGDTPIPVKLELDLLSRNLLVEEYPEAAAELKPIGATAGTSDRFLLQTNVYSLLGLGRFYCGLAGHITILDAPGLVEYAKGYFETALKELK